MEDILVTLTNVVHLYRPLPQFTKDLVDALEQVLHVCKLRAHRALRVLLCRALTLALPIPLVPASRRELLLPGRNRRPQLSRLGLELILVLKHGRTPVLPTKHGNLPALRLRRPLNVLDLLVVRHRNKASRLDPVSPHSNRHRVLLVLDPHAPVTLHEVRHSPAVLRPIVVLTEHERDTGVEQIHNRVPEASCSHLLLQRVLRAPLLLKQNLALKTRDIRHLYHSPRNQSRASADPRSGKTVPHCAPHLHRQETHLHPLATDRPRQTPPQLGFSHQRPQPCPSPSASAGVHCPSSSSSCLLRLLQRS